MAAGGKKGKKKTAKKAEEKAPTGEIRSKGDLKNYLMDVRDKMTDGTAAPVYALTAINSIMSSQESSAYLDDQNKEIARDIWLRIKQAGFQLKNPPMLFSEDEAVGAD